MWEAIGDDNYKEVVNQVAVTDFNDYNSASGSYNRIGVYKWSRTHWDTTTSTLAVYATEVPSRTPGQQGHGERVLRFSTSARL